MRELSIYDISKLSESKRNIVNNLGLYKYLGGNYLLYDKLILSDPISSTYIQMQNLDGTLDVLSESMRVNNISVANLGVFNKIKINNDFEVRGSSNFSGSLKVSNIINENEIKTKYISVLENASLSTASINKLNVYESLNISNIDSLDDVIYIGNSENNKIINIGNENSTVNILGNFNYKTIHNDVILNKELVINSISGNAQLLPVKDIGLFFSNGYNDKKGYLKTDSIDGSSFELKAPNNNYTLSFPSLKTNSSILYKEDDDTLHIENIYSNNYTNLSNLEVVSFATFCNFAGNELEIYGNISAQTSNIQELTVNDLNCNTLNITECSLNNVKIYNETVDNAKIDNAEIKQLRSNKTYQDHSEITFLKNNFLISDNSKIKTLNTVDFSVENETNLNSLIVKKNLKNFGNQQILGNLETITLNVSKKAILNDLYADTAFLLNLDVNKISNSSISSDTIHSRILEVDTMNIFNKLNLFGIFNFNNNCSIGGNLNVLNKLNVQESASLGDLNVINNSKFNNVQISGILNADRLNVLNNVIITGNLILGDTLNVIDDNIIAKRLFVKDNINVDAEISTSKLKVRNNLQVLKSVNVKENLNVDRNIVCNGSILGNSLTINQGIIASGHSDLTNLTVKNNLNVNGTILVNDIPIVDRNYIASLQATFNYFVLDGMTYNFDYVYEGTYTFIVNGQNLNKVVSIKEPVRNNIYTVAVDSDNNIYIGGQLNQNRLISKWLNINQCWEDLDYIQGNVVDIIKVDDRGVIYFAGDFKENGRLLQYIPQSNTWNKIGRDINGKINAIDFDVNNNVYIGGHFNKVNDILVNYIAKFDISTYRWSALGNGLNSIVNCLLIDTKDNLYIGGDFKDFIIKWNIKENKYEKFITLDRNVSCFAYDNNSNLYIGGRFSDIIIRHNVLNGTIEVIKNGLIGDIKCIAIDSNNNVFIATSTSPFIYRRLEQENKWVSCIKNINGLINSMCFDKNDKLYIAGYFTNPFSKLIIFDCDYTKTIRFSNLIKFVDEKGILKVSKRIKMSNIADMVSIKFTNGIGYLLHKSGSSYLV